MSGDYTKLPKWAQQRIATLEHNVERWKAKATAGPEDSNTFLRSGIDEAAPLGMNPIVHFVIEDRLPGKGVGRYIDVRLDGERLIVHGSEGTYIYPQASNAFHVGLNR